MPTRFHENIGYSIEGAQDKSRWTELVCAIADRVEELGVSEEIVFHGTSLEKARGILDEGMIPTDAFEIFPDGSEEVSEGSFWGTIKTAAWYAEDTSFHRSGGRPVIIACPVSFLQTYTTLCADIPSRDFPVPGLTKLDDPDIASEWTTGTFRSWQDSLRELGSFTAIHDYDLPLDMAILADTIESFDRILLSNTFSA
jgi:hypothetical protein